MGIMGHLFDSNYAQRKDINHQREALQSVERSTRRESEHLAERIKHLEAETAEIKLVCRTLLNVLIQHNLVTEDDFVEIAKSIQLSDSNSSSNVDRILPQEVVSPPRPQITIDFSNARAKP